MKTYLVGGAVRDMFMGIEPKDRDYVVVGSSPDEMIKLGFSQVGASFPVFLHPETGEEYALARTERKVGAGYNGFEVAFDPTVTLVEDLARRDLTMNAMAYDFSTGTIIDPFNGRLDIADRMIRHTSDAFAEDPVRVLRAARFSARYGFGIANETLALMGKVASELEFVPQERVFTEMQKGLSEDKAHLMIKALANCGALKVPCMSAYNQFSYVSLKLSHSAPASVKFVFISGGFTHADYERCRVPSDWQRYSRAYHEHKGSLKEWASMKPLDKIAVLDRMRAFSSTEVFDHTLAVLVIDGHGYEAEAQMIKADLAKAKAVDVESVIAFVPAKEIRQAIFTARANALS